MQSRKSADNMDFLAISAVVNVLISFVSGVFILSRNSRSGMHILFALFAFSVASWSTGYFFWLLSPSAPDALFWTRLSLISAILIPPLYLHLASTFTDKLRNPHLGVIISGYLAALGLILLSSIEPLISSVEQRELFSFWPVSASLSFLLVFFWLFYTLYALVLIFFHYRQHQGTKRVRAGYFLFGALFGVLGWAANYLLWLDVDIPAVSNMAVSIYVGITVHAIVSRGFNIRIVATEFFVFLLWLLALVKLLLADNLNERIMDLILFFAVIGVGILLKAREQSESLTGTLRGAGGHSEHLDKLKSEFVSIASHQLRSPISAIKGYASMLLEGSFGKLSVGAEEAVGRILTSSTLMGRSIDDFLNVSRIELGQMQYSMSTFDLDDLITLVIEELHPIAQEKNIRLSFKQKKITPCRIRADFGKIKQVLTNLVDNGLKYTPAGFVQVDFKKDPRRQVVTITVSDSGIGMSEETIGRLFIKFSRAHNANEVNVTGTGLGLYVAKNLVEAHGGSIWATSRGEGGGSTFYVELPMKTTGIGKENWKKA